MRGNKRKWEKGRTKKRRVRKKRGKRKKEGKIIKERKKGEKEKKRKIILKAPFKRRQGSCQNKIIIIKIIKIVIIII